MKRISNNRRNRNFLRLAALGSVVLLQTVFGGSRLADRAVDTTHSVTASEREQPAVLHHRAIQSKAAGSQNNQLSLMIFRSN